MSDQHAGIKAKVIADSIYAGSRLTTFEITFPRFILAEFNTHRVLSRNSASSRAIPVWKKLAEVYSNPFVPIAFGKNKSGMQSAENLSVEDAEAARKLWLLGRDFSVVQAYLLAGGYDQIVRDAKGDERAIQVCRAIEEFVETFKRSLPDIAPLPTPIHKQHANRVLEPYSHHTVIVTATDWRNFYALRASPHAQPEIKEVAIAMARAHMESVPQVLERFGWHMPFIFEEDKREENNLLTLAKISSARCARVSYLTHDGKRSLDADVKMANDLQKNGHMSPFEHPAKAGDTLGVARGRGGNFSDQWIQYRKMLDGEADFSSLSSRQELLLGMGGDGELVDFVLGLPS